MKNKLKYLLQNITRNTTMVSDDKISYLEELLQIKFPDDYISVIKDYNGGEGEIGENGWLLLFPVEQLAEINQRFELMKEIPEYLLFGKDAADTGYAIHKLNKTYHSFGLMSNFKTDPIEYCGSNFIEFLESIS